MKLGYIGIGLMGRPMVLRLLAAGHEVTVWNRSKDKLKEVLAKGAREAASGTSAAGPASVDLAAARPTAESAAPGAATTATRALSAAAARRPRSARSSPSSAQRSSPANGSSLGTDPSLDGEPSVDGRERRIGARGA